VNPSREVERFWNGKFLSPLSDLFRSAVVDEHAAGDWNLSRYVTGRRTRVGSRVIILLTAAIAGGCQQEVAPVGLPGDEMPLTRTELSERLGRIPQNDDRPETVHDDERCSCAAALSSYLLLGGDWHELITRHGLDGGFRDADLQTIQERLYELADVDGEPGVFGTFRPEFDETGRCLGGTRRNEDEFHHVLKALGLTARPIYGPTRERLEEKRLGVVQHFEQHPEGVLIIGVNQDSESFQAHPVSGQDLVANHYLVVFQQEGAYHWINSWQRPGETGLHRMTDAEIESFLFRTPALILAVELDSRPAKVNR
jgi:hypothetical protein